MAICVSPEGRSLVGLQVPVSARARRVSVCVCSVCARSVRERQCAACVRVSARACVCVCVSRVRACVRGVCVCVRACVRVCVRALRALFVCLFLNYFLSENDLVNRMREHVLRRSTGPFCKAIILLPAFVQST